MWWEQGEMMMLEAQVKGLQEEAVILQEQLESKDEALIAVQQAVTQVDPLQHSRFQLHFLARCDMGGCTRRQVGRTCAQAVRQRRFPSSW
jgi:hypothetical protein